MRHKQLIRERLLRGGGWAFTGKLFAALSVLVINSLLARLLSPQDMGAYFLTFSLVLVVSTVAQLGLSQSIVRFVAEYMGTGLPEKARKYIFVSLRLVGLGAGLGACFIAFGGGQWIADSIFNSPEVSSILGLAAIWVVIITFQQFISEVYRGFHDIKLATIFGGMVTAVLSILLFTVLWLLKGQSNLFTAVLLALVAGISSIMISSFILSHKLKKISPLEIPDWESPLKVVMSTSWPLLISNIAFLALSQADLWIVGAFLSSEDVALYGAAVRMASLITMPILIINSVVPPLIAEFFFQKRIDALEKTLRNLSALAFLPALFITVIFAFSGESVLGLIFGDFYKSAAIVLVLLSAGQLANVWAGSCGQALIMTGHQMIMMVIAVLSVLMTLFLALLLVNPYGVAGVACASASGITIQNIFMLFLTRIKLGVWTYPSFDCIITTARRIIRSDI